jgi:hypothetical protein
MYSADDSLRGLYASHLLPQHFKNDFLLTKIYLIVGTMSGYVKVKGDISISSVAFRIHHK